MNNIEVLGKTINSLYIFLAIGVVMLALVIIVIVSIVKISKLKKQFSQFMTGKDAKSLEDEISKRFKEIDELKEHSKKYNKNIKDIYHQLETVYAKCGIVKYDAFNEMGGKLSFALALLDKSNNGFVINAMHSREGCYTYIKEIVNGESYITLGDEEKDALQKAIKSDSVME